MNLPQIGSSTLGDASASRQIKSSLVASLRQEQLGPAVVVRDDAAAAYPYLMD